MMRTFMQFPGVVVSCGVIAPIYYCTHLAGSTSADPDYH